MATGGQVLCVEHTSHPTSGSSCDYDEWGRCTAISVALLALELARGMELVR